MASFRLIAAIEKIDEMLLLSIVEKELMQTEKVEFDLEKLTNDQCKTLFRFEKDDIPILCDSLRLPPKLECRNGTVCSNIEGLCILLRRITYPSRLNDLYYLFERSTSALSFIVNMVLDFLEENHGHLLKDLARTWLSEYNLREFAASVRSRGGPIPNCWGFIDGTVRPICRPLESQQLVYNGHKRVHALKFQSVVVPNGLIASMFGPMEGRRHDAGILRESDLMEKMRRHMTCANGEIFSLYGDPAYPLSVYIITPFRGGVISANQAALNKRMSAVRICVEWTFGKILSLFAFLDFKMNLKLHLQPVGKYYLVATLLTNCHTCLYFSETGRFFGIDPPKSTCVPIRITFVTVTCFFVNESTHKIDSYILLKPVKA